jgi:N-acetylmuramoyl-L-alanine amidase
MTTRLTRLTHVALTLMSVTLLIPAAVSAQSAQVRYDAAKGRDDKVRVALAEIAATAPLTARTPIVTESRAVIAAYEAIVRVHRASGYADNALYNAATLADALHDKFGLSTDRDAALRLYKRLSKEYPTAPLARQSLEEIARLEQIAEARKPIPPAALEGEPTEPINDAARPAAGPATVANTQTPRGRPKLLAIERSLLPGIVRVTLQLDREVRYHEETLPTPARVFFDLHGVEASPDLEDVVLRYPSDVVRQIRTGRHPNATRVVLDLEGVTKHSVYTLYNPFRIVVDAESLAGAPIASKAAAAAKVPIAPPPTPRSAPVVAPPAVLREPLVVPSVVPAEEAPATSQPVEDVTPVEAAAAAEKVVDKPATADRDAVNATPVNPAVPKAPAVNGAGGFSIARQLGLGVSRIVIDPGHGGHDPGAQARGLNEADLTLDLALRLEKLLQKEPGLEVVLTRRTDVYIPLEERTAIANREGADLFLSIHANTSRNGSARGVETYFLSFAGSADAEAVAARENSSHAGEMHKLPDIIRAITLNNKLDESRDLAGMVQEALVTRLRRSSKAVQNRGVKKAPFVVLIGAEMPSVLAEVSFMSNRQELQLLKTAAYKNRIAEALHAAVMRYRRSLKGTPTAAAQ